MTEDAGLRLRHTQMNDPLAAMLNDLVVLDTGTPIVYLGRLVELHEHAFVLESSDMHDCRDGHMNKEPYLAESQREGITINRRRVVVMRSAIISVSRLADIVQE